MGNLVNTYCNPKRRALERPMLDFKHPAPPRDAYDTMVILALNSFLIASNLLTRPNVVF